MILAVLAMLSISQTPIDKPSSYANIGIPTWGTRMAITAADTAYDVADGANKACFAYKTVVVVKASGGEIACAWTQDAGVTFTGNVDSANACDITDAAGYDGPGACFMLADKERVDQTPWFLSYRKPGDRMTGVCNGTAIAPGGAVVYVSCDADADCTGAGAGTTCDLTLDGTDMRHLEQQGCLFLTCQGDTATTWVYVGVEQ